MTTQPFARSEQFLFSDKYSDYPMYYKGVTPDDYVFREIINKTISRNPLTELFFSRKNVEHVTKLACQLIKLFCHQYEITPEYQNQNEMLTVFRSMYLQVPTDPYNELPDQLCKLNQAVLDWVVPRMICQIQQHLAYSRDQSIQPLTIPRFQNVSITGTKTNKYFASLGGT